MNIEEFFSKEVVQSFIKKDINKAFDDFEISSLMRSKITRSLIQNTFEYKAKSENRPGQEAVVD